MRVVRRVRRKSQRLLSETRAPSTATNVWEISESLASSDRLKRVNETKYRNAEAQKAIFSKAFAKKSKGDSVQIERERAQNDREQIFATI
jgi:hypothetical protein